MTLVPAEAGTGVVFLRADCPTDAAQLVPAHWSRVTQTQLRTEIGAGVASVSTIEHLMAALAGLGVDNALVELDGPEVPAMDGAAAAFVAAIREAGIARLSEPRKFLKVLQPVRVADGAAWAELAPRAGAGLHLDVEIAFAAGAIGRQRIALALTPESFARDLAPARSFGFVQDAERLWRAGLALGASLENSVVMDGERVLNPEGLRFPDECARHKALDLVGDLALAGAPIQGAVRSYRGGHTLNLALVEKLMTTRGAVAWCEAQPARRGARRGHDAWISP